MQRRRRTKPHRRSSLALPKLSSSWKHRFWHELHTRAASKGEFSRAQEKQFLADFTKRIPCSGCRQHWKQVIAKHRPRLSSRFEYFRWTVKVHNAINELLGKSTMSLAMAQETWNCIYLGPPFDTGKRSR